MKYIGIDYGKKKIGIALSDESGKMAFPENVLPNDKNLLTTLEKMCSENNVEAVVLGESRNLKGEANPILKDIENFKEKIEEKLKLEVFFMPEYLTSRQAHQIQGRNEMIDASAATIILQSFLDKQNSN